ncbi:hypothetical protein [Maritalea mediterranea]|uniref:Lipoprotein n=1 Tax=Maritalea mediterranea TaxID=2909667 RepID=A0ABS9EEE9_9HYPH|nr:hypothetical protein [Maritalea mediterranea]MCF4099783.1 hypothetical protein [Maritalea mediterranea]
MKNISRFVAIGLTVSFLAGCASAPKDIEAAYVSPVPYQSMSCNQLRTEAEAVSARAQNAAGVQKKKANNDAAATAVSLVLFWPAAFLIKGDSAAAAEVSRLKGEMNAIETVSRQKNCGIVFKPIA